MNWRIFLLLLVLADFAVLTAYAIAQVGYFGIWQAGFANWGSLQLLTDLVIVCGLACVWMIRDARDRGVAAWPFVVLTLAAGSFGPLLYLLRRELRAAATPQTVRDGALGNLG